MHLLVIIYLTLITVCGESSWKPTTNPSHSPVTTQVMAENGEEKKSSSSSAPTASFTSSSMSILSSSASTLSSTIAQTINKEATAKATTIPLTSKPESSNSNSPSTLTKDMEPSEKDASSSQKDESPLQKDTLTETDKRDQQENKLKSESAKLDDTNIRAEISSTRTSEEPGIKLWHPSTKTNTRGNEMSSSSTQPTIAAKRSGIAMSRRTISMSENDSENEEGDDDKKNNDDDDDDDDEKEDNAKTKLDTSGKEEKRFFKTTHASKLTTKDSEGSVLSGTTKPTKNSSKTKQTTKTNSDVKSPTLPPPTRPFKGPQQDSTEVKVQGVKPTQTVSVTSQTPVTLPGRRATSPATTRQILTGNKKKTKPKRMRKRKKKTMVNTGQPKFQIHSIDVPQPMPMLLSPKGRPEVKKKKRVNKKAANRAQGARGPKGEKGDRGEKGERGPPGPPANVTEDLPEVKLQAAATAVLTDHFGPDKNVIIPFDLKLIDLADNYDNSSGVFMTSIPGIYVISLYLMSHPGAKVNARIFINNRPVAALWADDSKNAGFYPSSSIQTISKLAFGDQVYVMLVDGGYGESWVHANYNAFSLYLLYEETFF